MNTRSIRRIAAVGLSALFAVAVAAAPALAAQRSDVQYGTYVTQTLTVDYNTQTGCSGTTGYQMTSIGASWNRSSSYVSIGTADEAAGEFGSTCNGGSPVAYQDSGNMAPSSWNGNIATSSRTLSNWPFAKLDPQYNTGASLNGEILYRNVFNQYLCSTVIFAGGPIACS